MLCKLLALCKYGLVRRVMTQRQGYLLFRRGEGQDVNGRGTRKVSGLHAPIWLLFKQQEPSSSGWCNMINYNSIYYIEICTQTYLCTSTWTCTHNKGRLYTGCWVHARTSTGIHRRKGQGICSMSFFHQYKEVECVVHVWSLLVWITTWL